MGFATNIDPERLRIFCRSARAIYGADACDIVLGVDRDHDRDPELAALGIRFLPTLNAYRKEQSRTERLAKQAVVRSCALYSRKFGKSGGILSSYPGNALETLLHPHIARWFFYKRAMEYLGDYGKVLVTDVTDVAFQAPFFDMDGPEREAAETGILFFEENGEYGASGFNDDNYIRTYGREAFARMQGRIPVCLGVILGAHPAMQALVDWMLASIMSAPNAGSDQVRGNHFAHAVADFPWPVARLANAADAVVHFNTSGLLAPGPNAVAELRDGAVLRCSDGRPAPIVHMYNRVPEVQAHLERLHLGARTQDAGAA